MERKKTRVVFVRRFVLLMFLSLCLTGCSTRSQTVRRNKNNSSMLVSKSADRQQIPYTHVVRKGETLWRISQKYGLALETFLRMNNLTKSSTIYPGQRLVVNSAYSSTKQRTYSRETLSKKGNFRWPVQGKVIHKFGDQKNGVPYRGIVVSTGEGTKVMASRGGIVTYVDDDMTGLGKVIIIEHGNGYSSVYAHNSKNMVLKGQSVKQGEIIALAGTTGRAEASQLYFEIRRNSRPINPQAYLK
ncbi:peptidoglycan DD-metalloendopeptidase family protein [PVC group bacterium]|nr:peptidoglycan DD-metalloendopeptidase family protein [PVC group bacterium]